MQTSHTKACASCCVIPHMQSHLQISGQGWKHLILSFCQSCICYSLQPAFPEAALRQRVYVNDLAGHSSVQLLWLHRKTSGWPLQIREILQAGIDAGKAGQGRNGSQEPETFFDAKDNMNKELLQAEQVPGSGKITTLGRDAALHLKSHFHGILHRMSLLARRLYRWNEASSVRPYSDAL